MPIVAATTTPFRHQPRWVLPSLAGIVGIAGILFAWNLGASGLSTYYAAAAKAMSESWAAFGTGAVNPSASVTLDKLAGFLVPQALSVRLFGFHAWALDLPQAVEGMVTVVATWAIAARWRGPGFGLAAAGVMTTTPIVAALFGHPTEDALLTMSLVLAFGAWQRSVLSGRYGWLVLAGVWIAVGFQAKMLQAWIILPALLVGTLIAGSGPWRGRLLRVASVGVITALLSLNWMTAIQLVPASDRPYVDGSTNDNTFSMVFAYNGLDRFAPGLIPGGVPQLGSQTGPHSGAGRGTATEDAAHSDAKLLMPELTTQAGWLAPAAIAGMVLGLVPVIRRRRAREAAPALADTDGTDTGTDTDRTELDRVMIVTLTVWALVTAAVFSLVWVPHASYLGAIALPAALLAVFGGSGAIRLFRSSSGWRGRAVLPALVLVQAAWQLRVVSTGPSSVQWLIPILVVTGAVAIVLLLVVGRTSAAGNEGRITRGGPSVTAAVAVAALSALLAPSIWSSFVLGPGGAGSAADSYAGPHVTPAGQAARVVTAGVPTVRAPLQAAVDPRLSTAQAELVADLRARNGSRTWLFATDTLPIAVDVLLATRDDVLPLGGFSQQAPTMTASQLESLIDSGQLRFVLLSNPAAVHPPNQTLADLRLWVRASCRVDRVATYRPGSHSKQVLYDCRP